MAARYLTTTLPYVNADPHIGHALEFIEADFFARTARLIGEDVFLNVGTDEHGAKIAQKAEQEGKSPQAYVDEYAARFQTFADRLDISYDAFTRTTNASHIAAAQEFWRRCERAGDIYKAEYEIKYCVGCELEKSDSELVNGHCVLHPTMEIEIRKEENYYFRFSKYQNALLEHYALQSDFVVPEGRMREITSFVEAGLKDFSISRRKEKLAWGVPVPGDADHVMYVWFDALVNYISAIGWPTDEDTFTTWWPVTQFAGKDNLRQQSAMWQAMLLSAGLPFSKQIFIHGFITSGGQKMSKSIGNVINPLDLVEVYGSDAVRYILLRHMSPFEDSDLTLAAIFDHYTAHLSNGLGNLVARVMTLAEGYGIHPVALPEASDKLAPAFVEAVTAFKFNEAMEYVFAIVRECDSFMATHTPYKYIKSENAAEREMAQKDILFLVEQLARIATHLVPAMPRTASLIQTAIRENKKPDNLFPRLSAPAGL
ncbi:MAG TPA: methionine--tRNA ligase [Candidatus Paceibacterota bacterium]|nr:methionine--tRNA ligase [Candidatus Paceibacterota bacterium]